MSLEESTQWTMQKQRQRLLIVWISMTGQDITNREYDIPVPNFPLFHSVDDHMGLMRTAYAKEAKFL
jgi:hypothetical protein